MQSGAILLVEDNPDDEALTLRALHKHNIGNEIVVAHDGAEALDYLFGTGRYLGRDANLVPELVLLDLNLRKVSGLEVLRRLRRDPRTARLAVVVLTSSNDERDLIDCYREGVSSYVRKPVEFSQFADAVSRLGCSWLMVNEPMP